MAKMVNLSKTADAKTNAILKLFTQRGIIAKRTEAGDTARRSQKKKFNVYHNTLSLLKEYRTIAWILECFPDSIAEELDKPFETVDELIDHVDIETAFGNSRLENRIESMKKTRMILDRINDALTVLKKLPGEGERLYELLYLTYIAPETLNHNELLYRLNLSSRHYYRLRERAISVISIRLWSAPNRDIEFWLDLISVLEAG